MLIQTSFLIIFVGFYKYQLLTLSLTNASILLQIANNHSKLPFIHSIKTVLTSTVKSGYDVVLANRAHCGGKEK